MKKRILTLCTIFIALFIVTGCGSSDEPVSTDLLGIDFNVASNESVLDFGDDNPIVAIYIENYGAVVFELFPEFAPNTVNNFLTLAKEGFYDGNTFHRLVHGFVLQGGDPTGTGMGGAEYNIVGEFEANGIENPLTHSRGVISMARALDYDSASSQFFIMLGDHNTLDREYAAFGRVIAGMDMIDRIAREERVADDRSGALENNLRIVRALVDLRGYEIGEIERISRN